MASDLIVALLEIFPFVIVLAVPIILLLAASIKIVRQGHNYTVELFGRYTRTLEPGLYFLIPFVERIGSRVNMMENVLDIGSQEAITKDNASIHVDGIVFYRIFDAYMASYNVGNVKAALEYLATTNIRTVMGSMDLDELLSNREMINAKLLSAIENATKLWGVLVTRIEIQDIIPPRDLLNAMAQQMKAERDKRARILEAEGLKESAITKAEGERQAVILKAESEKAARILEAEARLESALKDADARQKLAEAEAYATNVMSEAITKGNSESIHYFVAQKYVDAFSQFANSGNTKTFFIPTDFLNVVKDFVKK